MVTLTTKAAQKIRELAQKQGKPGGFLRLRVASGGCSGLSYEFEISDALAQGDEVFESEGAKLVLDARSHEYVKDSRVDYFQSMMKSGFEVKNPNAVSSCACGTSFST